jgi:hypothetical protein
MTDGYDPIVRTGDLIRISVELIREWSEVTSGFRSPLVRVKEIRRDANNHVELLLETTMPVEKTPSTLPKTPTPQQPTSPTQPTPPKPVSPMTTEDFPSTPRVE